MNQHTDEPSFEEALFADRINEVTPIAEFYDAVEVGGIAIEEAESGEIHEPDDSAPDYFSSFLHCKAGGRVCIGDHPTEARAIAYANEIADRFGLRRVGG